MILFQRFLFVVGGWGWANLVRWADHLCVIVTTFPQCKYLVPACLQNIPRSDNSNDLPHLRISLPDLGISFSSWDKARNLEQRFRYIYSHIPRAKTSHIPIELLRFVVV